jgi:hypothetical protein
MLVTGGFGLKTYDLSNPASPRLLGEVTAEQLRLPGDPPVSATSTFWQNEDMDVDRKRKIAILSRDPRAYLGSTSREPGEPDPNGATNIAGAYRIDVADPRRPRILSFTQLPTGHTSTCINDCQYLWTGGPASTTTQRDALGWALGRPLIVTDIRNPRKPVAYPSRPVDLFRADGVTAYSHDVQVDDAGVAWVSGNGGTRGYLTSGFARDPLTGKKRWATPLDPIPYAGGGFPDEVVGVGNWNPFEKEGTRTEGLSFCSAHYFDVDDALVTYACRARGPGSSTSPIRRTRSRWGTTGPTTAGSGRPTTTRASSTRQTRPAAWTSCASRAGTPERRARERSSPRRSQPGRHGS